MSFFFFSSSPSTLPATWSTSMYSMAMSWATNHRGEGLVAAGPDTYRPNISESPWEDSTRAAMDQYSYPPRLSGHLTESLTRAANDWNPLITRSARSSIASTPSGPRQSRPRDHQDHSPKRQFLFRETWAPGGNRGVFGGQSVSVKLATLSD